MKATVKIRKRGTVVIPDSVRTALKLKEGMFLELDIRISKEAIQDDE